MITGIIIAFTLTIIMSSISSYFFIKVKEDRDEKMTKRQKDFYRAMAMLVWPWYVVGTLRYITEKNCNNRVVSLLLAFTLYYNSVIVTMLLSAMMPPHKTIVIGGSIFIIWTGLGYIIQSIVDYRRSWYIAE